MLKVVAWICLLSFPLVSSAQVEFYVDGQKRNFIHQPSLQNIPQSAQRIVTEYVQDGYLFAGIDSIVSGETERVYIHRGDREEVLVDSLIVFGNNLSEIDYRKVRSTLGILNDYISQGYPFASLTWHRITQDQQGRLHGHLQIDPGPFVVNDTLALLSPVNTKPAFIQKSIGLEAGEPFDELAFQSIEEKLSRLPYLQLLAPPDIAFSGGRAITYLTLEENPASSFEGIVGLLPNQGLNNGMLLTGYIDLSLANLFNAGKGFKLNWQQFAASSQQLDLEYDHTYLFGSNVLVKGAFNWIKQDTTFVTRRARIEIGAFLFKSNVRFDASYERSSGDLISVNPIEVSNSGLADYSIDQYAIGLTKSSTYNRFADYFNYKVRTSIGRKSIDRNSSLPTNIYDTLRPVSSVVQFMSNIQGQKIVRRSTALFFENEIRFMANPQPLTNELHRAGGLRSLRGFNENFFFVQNYLLNRMELRQYFEEQSFLFAFYDQMMIATPDKWQYPLGFGLGLTLDTGNGLFNFVFALGRSNDIPIDLNNTKIHLGYTSRF